MAHVRRKRFFAKSETGEQMDFEADITVSAEGEFRVAVPDELEEVRGIQGVTIRRAHKGGRLAVYAPTMDQLVKDVKRVMLEYLACEETVERVILYGKDCQVSYCTDRDGNVHPNGVHAMQSGGTYKSHGPLHARSHHHVFSVGVVARVYDKHTFRRGASVKVDYRTPPDQHDRMDDVVDPLGMLNSFAGVGLDPDDCREIPYSDEAARFFFQMMIGICRLAHQIDGFLGDGDLVRKAIEQKAGFLQIAPATLNNTALAHSDGDS